MQIRRKMKTLVAVGAVGATIAYLFDPVNGRQRRERFTRTIERRSDDVRHAAHSVERATDAITPDSRTDASSIDDGAEQQPVGGTRQSGNDTSVDPAAVDPPDVAGVTDTPPASA